MGHPANRGFKKSGTINVELQVHTKVCSQFAEVDFALTLFGTTNRQSFRSTIEKDSERYRLIKKLHDTENALDQDELMEMLEKIKAS